MSLTRFALKYIHREAMQSSSKVKEMVKLIPEIRIVLKLKFPLNIVSPKDWRLVTVYVVLWAPICLF